MKKIFLSLLFLPTIQLLMAAPVGLNQARMQAGKFLSSAVADGMMRQASGQKLTLAYSARQGNDNTLYVFNREGNAGYVIVSGDDRTTPVLGYCDRGSFSITNAPSNLKAWLEGYERQIAFLFSHPQLQNNVSKTEGDKTVGPLLGDIEWDQGEPYNKKCPYGCATGCVATAMSQIMYYHKWPVQGIGSNSYTTTTQGYQVSANFGNTVYQWDKMLPALNENSPAEAIDAVSTLIFHAGVSVNMDYDESSGAYSYPISQALVKNFGYDAGASYRMRNYYTSTQWEEMLRNELDNGRPVVYDGATYKQEGHSFVCDGYNESGYFHINWGWSGIDNGYFLLTALDPETMGIGGSASGLGFNYNQDMIIGIQRPTENSKMSYVFDCDQLEALSAKKLRQDTVTFIADEVYNDTYDTVSASLRFNVYDNTGKVVATSESKIHQFSPYKGYSTVERRFAVPDSLPDGIYRARFVFAPIENGEKGDYQLVNVIPQNNNYYRITVKGDSVVYSEAGASAFSLEDYTVNPTPMESDKESEVIAKIHNEGGEFSGNLYFSLAPVDNDVSYKTYTSPAVQATLASEATTDVDFKQTFSLPGGQYKLRFYVAHDDLYWEKVGKTDTVTIKGPQEPADILVDDDMWFEPDNDNVPKDDMRLHAILKNEGGNMTAKIVPLIFDPDDDWTPVASMDTIEVNIGRMKTDTIVFYGEFLNAQTGKTYEIEMYNVTAQSWLIPSYFARLNFTMGEATGIRKAEAAAEDSDVYVYNTTGRLVLRTVASRLKSRIASLPKGVYVMKKGLESRTFVR